MAGKNVYLGKMLQGLEANIDDLKADMGTMSTDMGQMVAELLALKTTVGQGIQTVNIKAGTGNTLILNAAEISHSQFSGSNRVVYSIVVMGTGTFNIVGNIKSGSGNCAMTYSQNGIEKGDIVAYPSALSYKPFNKNIAVVCGDILAFSVHERNGTNGTIYIDTGSKVQYDLIDIVNQGAIVKV